MALEMAAKPGLSPHGGCPRSLRCEPPQFHGSQTLGTAPDDPGDSPESPTKLLKLAPFEGVPGFPIRR
jgi:hypothetical protein